VGVVGEFVRGIVGGGNHQSPIFQSSIEVRCAAGEAGAGTAGWKRRRTWSGPVLSAGAVFEPAAELVEVGGFDEVFVEAGGKGALAVLAAAVTGEGDKE
jgi:hypothetical protein